MKKSTIAMINRNTTVSPKALKEILNTYFTITGEDAISRGETHFHLGSATTYEALESAKIIKENVGFDIELVEWIEKRIHKFANNHTFEGYHVKEATGTASYFKNW